MPEQKPTPQDYAREAKYQEALHRHILKILTAWCRRFLKTGRM
jgi:hypothetical protein